MLIETCTDVVLLEKMLQVVASQISRTEDKNEIEELTKEKEIVEYRLMALRG